MKINNWRDELQSCTTYKKKFAFVGVNLSDGDKIWFKSYYRKYIIYGSDDVHRGHVDFVENISEAEYIVRKLQENY